MEIENVASLQDEVLARKGENEKETARKVLLSGA
jgi:hypothetical protein